ncbi:MAG: oxidoreductase [Fimbriimonadaceae bacterium]|nr:oxidoreductase [Chitinophagales bacterium]
MKLLTQGVETSIRGLSVVDENIIWASGSNGYIARSTDGGNNFKFQQIYPYDKAELRDIYAFDSNTAIVMSSTQPACILKTVDGGKSWKKVFEDLRADVFLDGFDFWDKQKGICFGDPISNKFLLLTTTDGGDNWKYIDSAFSPVVQEGTAAFAASGSSIQCLKAGEVYFATGGTEAVLFFSADYGLTWKRIETPMPVGYESSGIFSIDFLDKKHGCIVGGDFTLQNAVSNNFYYTKNGGKTWEPATAMPAGYRSSVKYIDDYFLLACGNSGIDVAYTQYYRFTNFSNSNYNVIATDKERKIVFIAGNDGKIAMMKK